MHSFHHNPPSMTTHHPFISVPKTSHNALLAPRRSPVSSLHTESDLKLYLHVSLSFCPSQILTCTNHLFPQRGTLFQPFPRPFSTPRGEWVDGREISSVVTLHQGEPISNLRNQHASGEVTRFDLTLPLVRAKVTSLIPHTHIPSPSACPFMTGANITPGSVATHASLSRYTSALEAYA